MRSPIRVVVPLVLVAAGVAWWFVRDTSPPAADPTVGAAPHAGATGDAGGDAARPDPNALHPNDQTDPNAVTAGATPTRTEDGPPSTSAATADGTARIAGRVVDEGGRPIAGATVELARAAGGLLPVTEPVGAPTRTSGAGGYAFENVPVGAALSVRATATGFAEARGDALNAVAGRSVVVRDLVLPSGVVLTGHITSAERGTSVAGASVTMRLVRGGVVADPLDAGFHAQSDASGKYRVEGLLPETYRFTVVADGYVDAQKDRSFFAARTRKDAAFDIALEPSAGDVAGKAVDAAGAPVADASITATAARDNATPHVVVAQSRADGTFELPRLGPWPYRVEASAAHHCLAQSVDLRASDRSITLVFARKARIEGKVVFDGAAGIARVDASFAPSDGTSPKLFAQTPAAGDGAFVVEDVPSGSIVLDVASDVGAPTRFGPFVVAPGAQLTGVELRVARGAIARGRVLQSDGSPAAHASVVLVPADFDVTRVDAALILLEGTSRKNARTDAAGAFTLEGLPDGAFRVRADAPGFGAAWSATFSTTEQPETSVGVLRLTPACAIEGLVVDASGGPVAQAIVRARTADGFAGGITASDGLGRFRFGTLAPGDWVVSAVKKHPQFGALDETAEAKVAANAGAAATVRLQLAKKE